jgi:hypothetical protein
MACPSRMSAVALGSLAGLGDVAGLGGSESLTQAFAGLPQELEGLVAGLCAAARSGSAPCFSMRCA